MIVNNRQDRSQLRPGYGYALLVIYLIGCAGGAWAIYRNHGQVPEMTAPVTSIPKRNP
jgi:hypothetical protein